MTSAYQQVTTLALQLPAEDRLALASELIDSVEEPADPTWAQGWLDELHARKAQGLRDARPWSDVRADILRKLAGP